MAGNIFKYFDELDDERKRRLIDAVQKTVNRPQLTAPPPTQTENPLDYFPIAQTPQEERINLTNPQDEILNQPVRPATKRLARKYFVRHRPVRDVRGLRR